MESKVQESGGCTKLAPGQRLAGASQEGPPLAGRFFLLGTLQATTNLFDQNGMTNCEKMESVIKPRTMLQRSGTHLNVPYGKS